MISIYQAIDELENLKIVIKPISSETTIEAIDMAINELSRKKKIQEKRKRKNEQGIFHFRPPFLS